MRYVCLLAVMFGWAACASAVDFGQRGPERRLQAAGVDENYYGQAVVPAESSRIHHGGGKHKMKKMKKRLLLQCLLAQRHRRRRRDTDDVASGRFLLPIAVQSTNVNVGGGGYGGHGLASNDPQYGGYGGGGCMQMINDHGPSLGSGPLGSLGSLGSLGGLLGSAMEGGNDVGSRGGSYGDWNRYARQFHRSFVRPLYRVF